MNEVERRVVQTIDAEGLVTALCELVSWRSLSGEETPAQEHMAGLMGQAGLDVDVWDIDFAALRRHPAYSEEVARRHGLGVVGTLGSGEGRSLILNGHIDVVPAGERANWTFEPWQGTVAHGRVYGRGALDMKGGLLCALFAARAIRDAGVSLQGPLMLQSVIGEEDGGVGTLATILRGYRADAAIIMEPTQLMVAPAQAGALNFRVTVPGRAAHGCYREEGVSAIEKFIPLYQAIMALEARRNAQVADPMFAPYRLPYPIAIGTIEGGNWASTVPEQLTFAGRYGVAVGEDLAAAQRQLEQAVVQAAQGDPWLRAHPPRLEWWGGQFAPARIAADHPIVTTLAGAFTEVAAHSARIQGMTYGADMRLLVNEGHIPTVLFGPGDVRLAHQPDESVPVADLITATRVLALTALRYCGYAT